MDSSGIWTLSWALPIYMGYMKQRLPETHDATQPPRPAGLRQQQVGSGSSSGYFWPQQLLT